MRILHFHFANPSVLGGGAIRTNRIYDHFPAGNEIRLVHGKAYDAKIPSHLNYVLSARRHIAAFKPDLVVEDWSANWPTFIPYYWGGPHIAVIQALYGLHHHGARGLISECLDRLALKKFKRAITVCEHYAQRIRPVVPNTTIVYNGIDSSLLETEPFNSNYILFLGRWDVYQKGLDMLIEAYRKVEKYLPVLVIAGGGKDFMEVSRLVEGSERIALSGHVEGVAKAMLLKNCTFFVSPSRFESWGISMAEAQASQKGVLAFDIDCLRENVINGETGRLLPYSGDYKRDVWTLIDGLVTYYKTREFEKHGILGRERMRKFTWEEVSKGQYEIYREVLNETI